MWLAHWAGRRGAWAVWTGAGAGSGSCVCACACDVSMPPASFGLVPATCTRGLVLLPPDCSDPECAPRDGEVRPPSHGGWQLPLHGIWTGPVVRRTAELREQFCCKFSTCLEPGNDDLGETRYRGSRASCESEAFHHTQHNTHPHVYMCV